MSLILSSLSQGILWSVMAIGVYITFRILDIADLTAEGSFPLGAAICATGIVSGLHPLLASLLAFVGGLLAGLVSGLIHTKLKIPALLTGIITLTALYSVNLKVLGKANLALLGQETLVSKIYALGFTKTASVMIMGLVFLLVILLALTLFMRTQIGLALRASGDNLPMSASNGVYTDQMKIIAYMLSNALIALCGALLCQNNGYADLNSGVGTIVIGLASIIIAEVVLPKKTIGWRLASLVLGSIIYRLIILAILSIPGMDADLVKLCSAILLASVLYLPQLQKALQIRKPKLN
ncbi:ABC transporter permease [Streptococcus catagoni]|uniref:ABC transporter permease n=1 Tax=Streptococcus catagoni TaxID=2654874 RepID=UPI00140A99DB|nr:ABC transporter permease [Streptococcus catagoni]